MLAWTSRWLPASKALQIVRVEHAYSFDHEQRRAPGLFNCTGINWMLQVQS